MHTFTNGWFWLIIAQGFCSTQRSWPEIGPGLVYNETIKFCINCILLYPGTPEAKKWYKYQKWTYIQHQEAEWLQSWSFDRDDQPDSDQISDVPRTTKQVMEKIQTIPVLNTLELLVYPYVCLTRDSISIQLLGTLEPSPAETSHCPCHKV